MTKCMREKKEREPEKVIRDVQEENDEIFCSGQERGSRSKKQRVNVVIHSLMLVLANAWS